MIIMKLCQILPSTLSPCAQAFPFFDLEQVKIKKFQRFYKKIFLAHFVEFRRYLVDPLINKWANFY